MTVKNFLKDRFLLLVLHAVCMFLLAVFLRLTGYGAANTGLVLIFWLLILIAWLGVVYIQRQAYFREAGQILERIDQRYLLGELLPDSFRLEDRLYREMIRHSNKSVIERIRRIEDERQDYKEYIESWVHEVKAPITSIALVCENGRRQGTAKRTEKELREAFGAVSLENQRLENYVDMVLYYARSEELYKDYLIQETELQEVVYEVLEKNRLLMIQNQVRAEVEAEDKVYTDRKWIGFILNQMLLNSVKYCGSQPAFHIYTERKKGGVWLVLEDNGTGIRPEELSRILKRDLPEAMEETMNGLPGWVCIFAGSCVISLGSESGRESEYGSGTRMFLEFPISNYISR